MLKKAFSKESFSAADTAHRAPYAKISFATQQNEATTADVTSLTLTGIVLCSTGEAEGWGISIDEKFITDMVKDIKANQKKGVKSNLRHNYENAGFQLGRITNVRIEGDRVLGDLKCYASADKSPLAPGMASWLISLVAEDPEAMMMSIVAEIAYYFQRDENGNEIKVWEYNAEDSWISPNYDMPIYCAYGSIESCDAVADGALTEAMFSKTPETESGFFSKLQKIVEKAFSRGKSDPDEADADLFPAPSVVAATIPAQPSNTSNNMENTAPTMAVEFAAAQAKVIELTAQLEAKTFELTAVTTAKTTADTLHAAAIAERDTQIVALKAEVAVLKELPADDHAGGNTNTTFEAGKGLGPHHAQLARELGLSK